MDSDDVTVPTDEDVAPPPEDVTTAKRLAPSPPWSEQAKLLVVGTSLVLGVIGVYLVRNVIAIAALAALIAFLIAPLMNVLTNRLRIPRGLSLLVAYLVVFIGTLAFGYLLTRSIVASVIELDPIGSLDDFRTWLLAEVDADGRLVLFGLTIDMSGVLSSLGGSVGDSDSSGGFVLDAEAVLQYLGTGLSEFRTAAGLITALITSAIVTALVAMYLNADSIRMHDTVVENLPPGYERDGILMMREQKRVWRGYLYGQLVNSLITGLLVFVVLWLVGLPGAFVMGMIMVVLNMIPTFGPILAAIPGVLAALISGSTRWPDLESFWFALIVAGIYLVVVQLQANIIAPRVMGTAVRLRPAVVLLGLLVGFQVGGLLGTLLAVPVIASLRDIGVYVWRKLIDVDPWLDEPVDELPPG